MRKYKYLVLLLAFAMIAAACGGDDGGSGGDTGGGDETTATTAAPEEFVPGPLGAVEVAPGEAIQIRSLEAITGDVAFLGVPNQRGTELAIADYGEILGHAVNMGTGLDDLCSADGGQAAAQSIVADTQVVGVIGTSCSGAAGAAMPLISDAGMVMISPSNTSPALTSDLAGNANSDYSVGYYRTAHNDLFQGRAVANFVYNELGLTNAGVIHDGDLYTNGLALAFQAAFEELGGTVSVFTAVNKGDTDMTAVLTEVAAGAPEVIFTPTFPPEVNFIAQQVRGIAGLEDVVMVGADASLVDNFLEIPEAEGWYHSGPDTRFGEAVNEITGVSANDFLAAYEAAYGEAPSAPFWAHSYDATTLLLQAIENVAVDQDGTLFIDRQALRDELNSLTFDGIIGHIDCDDFGDCGAQKITIIQNNSPNDLDAAKANVVYSFAP